MLNLPRIVRAVLAGLLIATLPLPVSAANAPARAQHGMVVSADLHASRVGVAILEEGGNAIDAAVAVAFALAVTHPTAGNIGGGGFIIHQPRGADAVAYDFRETAPAAAHPDMWLEAGKYSARLHHHSHKSVGVPGTVAGLHMAWQDAGSLPWARLIAPAIRLARDGFKLSNGLARSLEEELPRMQPYPASIAAFSRDGVPYATGDLFRQPDLAASLKRIAQQGPDGFYKGRTADLIVAEMQAGGGLITHQDLADYRPRRREPLVGEYRGFEIVSMPPPSSGGVTLVQMLNVLEGYDMAASGFGSAANLHRMAEAMRRAYADRARFLGDPDFVEMPLARLTSDAHAEKQRRSINPDRASVSSPDNFDWPVESSETTHFSVVDKDRNAVSLTYTLEYGYGSAIVVPGGGFLLNNEMGDFNAGVGLTDSNGLIGTSANLAEPGKRMLSSMTPTIVNRGDELFMVTGSPGGRTIINTVLQTIVNVIDYGMNAQVAVDAGRVHHQWLPDRLSYEKYGFSPDTLALLRSMGHELVEDGIQGVAEVIVVAEDGWLEGGVDLRVPDGAAAGY
ncbi:MAG: gamma-glutamyltransferase [Pseudomonadales bacterium]|nr:gamma-glutamyltransferase [Pseudomonadales bacterium]